MKRRSMPKTMTAVELRHNLGEVLDLVAGRRERFLVSRGGIPAAIILSVHDYEDAEDLLDTLREQTDEGFQQSLVKAREDIEHGRIATLRDLRRDLEAKTRGRKRRA